VGRADLHIHTRVSDGLGTVEQVLRHAVEEARLDVIAVTDHEDIRGGLRAREFAARHMLSIEVIPAVEVTTLQGHLLALYVERDVRSFRSIEATLEEIHSQHGIAIAPHPMSWLTRSLSRRTLDRIAGSREDGTWLDAIEVANPSPAGRQTRIKTVTRNRERWRLPEVAGSDAHHLGHIGTAWTEFPGSTAKELRHAIEGSATRGVSTGYPPAGDIGLGKLALGLAWGYTATPRKLLSGRALRRA
jgi:predicted metal-dependent phosphoesterase TrpH